MDNENQAVLPEEEEYMHVLKPTSAIVFGILNIFFAVLAVGGTAVGYLIRFIMPMNEMQRNMQLPLAYEIFAVILNLCLAIYLFINGIMLLKAGLSARKGFLIYCIAVIIITPLLQIYPMIHILKVIKDMPNSQMVVPIMFVSMFFGFLLAMAYPVIGLIFMTRPAVKEHYDAYNHPQNMANPGNSPLF